MYTAADCTDTLRTFAAGSRARDTTSSDGAGRDIRITVPDLDQNYYTTLVGRHLEEITDQPSAGPTHITLTLDSATLVELFSGKLSPFAAISGRRVKLDASMRDMPRLRALFAGAGSA